MKVQIKQNSGFCFVLQELSFFNLSYDGISFCIWGVLLRKVEGKELWSSG